MAYNKQTWNNYDESKTEQQNISNGAVVTPDRMNYIENGIEEASKSGGENSGEPGKSAYEVALDNGFVGSEQDWLASLEGTPGRAATVNIGSVTVDESATIPQIDNSGDENDAIFDFTFPAFSEGGGDSSEGYQVVNLDLTASNSPTTFYNILNDKLVSLGYTQTGVSVNSYALSVDASNGLIARSSIIPSILNESGVHFGVLLIKKDSPILLFMSGNVYSNTETLIGSAIGDKDANGSRIFRTPTAPPDLTNLSNLKNYLLRQMPAPSTVNAYSVPATTSEEELNTAINAALTTAAQAQAISLQQAQNQIATDEDDIQLTTSTVSIPYYTQTDISVVNEQLTFDSVSGEFSISDEPVEVTDGGQLFVSGDGPLTLILKSGAHQGTYLADGTRDVSSTREFRKKAEGIDALNNFAEYFKTINE